MRRVAAAVLLLPAAIACHPRATAGRPSSGAELQQVVVTESRERGYTSLADGRQLIRRATMSLEVDDVGPLPSRASSLATALGGYVQSTAQGSERWVHVVLRVPSSSLEAALDSLGRLGHVTARSISAEDVTEQVVDLDARLASLRASRDRFRMLLDRSATVADVVAVERELARVQGELDSLEGRLKYLRGSVALAELTLDVRQRRILGPLGVVVEGLARLIGKLFVIR